MSKNKNMDKASERKRMINFMKNFMCILTFLLLVFSCNISKNQTYIDEDAGLSKIDSIDVSLYYHRDRKVDNWEDRTFKISIEELKNGLASQNIQIDSLFSDEFDLSSFLRYGFEELREDCEYPDTFIPEIITLSILDTIKISSEYEAYPYELTISGLCKNRLGNIVKCEKIINPSIRTEEIKEINRRYYSNSLKKFVNPAFLVKERYYSNFSKRMMTDVHWDDIKYGESLIYKEDFNPEYFTYLPFSYNNVEYYLTIINRD